MAWREREDKISGYMARFDRDGQMFCIGRGGNLAAPIRRGGNLAAPIGYGSKADPTPVAVVAVACPNSCVAAS
ncbi:hypothetical protein NL676_037650 [Syzygium grande]|nr:hypothetical protein NL676_037650 [Syzygium grande]